MRPDSNPTPFGGPILAVRPPSFIRVLRPGASSSPPREALPSPATTPSPSPRPGSCLTPLTTRRTSPRNFQANRSRPRSRASSPHRISPPRGGRQGRQACAPARDRFNPRPREGGDDRLLPVVRELKCFNPRPREGGDGHGRGSFFNPKKFQSTPPRGGRPGGPDQGRIAGMFQSTPPRGGRPQRLQGQSLPLGVSIHAPARGATIEVFQVLLSM